MVLPMSASWLACASRRNARLSYIPEEAPANRFAMFLAQVKKHVVSDKPRSGANGIPYLEKEFSVWRGSQRVKAARIAGYTHIEGVII